MIVKVSRAKLHVGIPAIKYELRADDLAHAMGKLQCRVKMEGLARDGQDAGDLEGFDLLHAHPNQHAGLKALRVCQAQASGAGGAPAERFSPSLVNGRTL